MMFFTKWQIISYIEDKMKLNITVGGEAKNGYFNIDPLANQDDGVKLAVPMHDLSVVENAICYLPHDHVFNILAHWISKLRHKGTLIITGFDAREITKRYMAGIINLDQFNEIMFGTEQVKRNGLDMHRLDAYLRQLNMQVTSKKMDSSKFTIVARRP